MLINLQLSNIVYCILISINVSLTCNQMKGVFIMPKFAIIGDSTCDLTREMRDARNIDYARMLVSWTDVKDKKFHEIYASLDWEDLSVKEYYDVLRAGNRIITSQVTEQEYDEVFGRHFKKGEDILYIACSSGLSASIKLAHKLWNDKYSKEYPDRKMIIIDSLISCMGQGMMLLHAADLRDEGKSMEEIAEELEKTKLCYNQVATVESLEYLKRAGRVKASSAFFGNIFGVKPILISDTVGMNHAIEKAKGRKGSLIRCAEYVKETVTNPETQTCWVLHADAKQEDVDLVVSKIKELVPFKEIKVMYLGPIIGASTGPGTFGIFYYGKEVTVSGEVA